MTELRRKLYRRGSSYETTIPMPLLFALDTTKKHEVVFRYDPASGRWYVEFAPIAGMDGKKRQKEEKQ